MIQSGWYLASTSNINAKYDSTIGYMHTVRRGRSANGDMARARLERGVVWGLDNGMFTGTFEIKSWIDKMNAMRKYKENCLFVVVPDVIQNSLETIRQFDHYRNMIDGYPVAFVSHDGIGNHMDLIPWDSFDCMFIGGSDKHKMGAEARLLIEQSKKRKKWIHVGRVNSKKRIINFWDCDSWDGTNTSFQPSNVKNLSAAVLQTRVMKKSKGLFDDIYNNVFDGNNFG